MFRFPFPSLLLYLTFRQAHGAHGARSGEGVVLRRDAGQRPRELADRALQQQLRQQRRQRRRSGQERGACVGRGARPHQKLEQAVGGKVSSLKWSIAARQRGLSSRRRRSGGAGDRGSSEAAGECGKLGAREASWGFRHLPGHWTTLDWTSGMPSRKRDVRSAGTFDACKGAQPVWPGLDSCSRCTYEVQAASWRQMGQACLPIGLAGMQPAAGLRCQAPPFGRAVMQTHQNST
eukprot:274357-Chlamydomonas_euryale.AAC.11